jgi:O-antigen ligase
VASQGKLRRLGAFQILAIAFLILITASVFWTEDPAQTPLTIRVYYEAMSILWLVWEFARNERRLAQLRVAFVLGECVLVALTVQSFLHEHVVERAKEARFAAEGWNWNDMAIMIALGVPFACYLAVRSEKRAERTLGWTSLVLSVVGIVLTSSRTGLLGIAFGILTLPVLQPLSSARTKLLAVPLLAATVYAAFLWLPAQSFDRLGTTMTELTSGGLNNRTAIWAVGLLAFPHHWLVGVGAGAWIAGTGNFYSAHSLYLEILVEEGVAGFVLFLLMLWSISRGIARSRGPGRRASAMLLISFLVLMIASHWAQLPATWFILGWIAAAGNAKCAAEDNGLMGALPENLLAGARAIAGVR